MRLPPIEAFIIGIVGVAISAHPGRAQRALQHRIDSAIVANESKLIEIRHDIHRNPEVSGNEVRTAALVANQLRKLGLDVRTGVGGHGVVGVLKGGRPGPTIAYRADMDAVFSNDPDPVEYRSVLPGVRHICGHDMHTTIALALAEGFAAVRADLQGTVMFVIQPAEERATGANAMLADGVFAINKPTAIFGLHTAPTAVGRLASSPGALMAARDRITVTINGTGDLRTAADSTRRIIRSFGTIQQPESFRPTSRDFVFVQLANDRAQTGAIAFEGTISMASNATRSRVRTELQQLLGALTRADVRVDVRYEPKHITGIDNDSLLTAAAVASVRATLGEASTTIENTVIPAFSEDFGAFQQHIPGVFFFLGVSNPARGTRGYPHTPNYVADDGAILVGARAMTAVLLDQLAAGARRPANAGGR